MQRRWWRMEIHLGAQAGWMRHLHEGSARGDVRDIHFTLCSRQVQTSETNLLNATLPPTHSSFPSRFSQVWLQIALRQVSAPGQVFRLDTILLCLCWDTYFFSHHGFYHQLFLLNWFLPDWTTFSIDGHSHMQTGRDWGIQFGNNISPQYPQVTKMA